MLILEFEENMQFIKSYLSVIKYERKEYTHLKCSHCKSMNELTHLTLKWESESYLKGGPCIQINAGEDEGHKLVTIPRYYEHVLN